MKNLFYAIIVLIFWRFDTNAQPAQFDTFAKKQDALFIKAYEQRNILECQKLIDELMIQYRALDKTRQKKYISYVQNAFYNLSCTYSLLKEVPRALEYLNKAVKAGYSNYTHLLQDPDMDNIRQEKQFQSLMTTLRAVGDYRFILEKGAGYDLNEKRELPLFAYQPDDKPALVAFRKAYRLDSIAGDGNEILKMINLMHWVHGLIPHDGNHANPQIKNGMALIDACKREQRGLNCRGLATVLNECYLAMGLKSRFVTCLPKDSLKNDPDCHVINCVYSSTLKKWLWMDPTNDAYVMDEKGELLGIEEVRKRIINDQPLILNPTANWNNRVSKNKEDYLYDYMAKNLYMLQCSVASEYNAETIENGKSVEYVTLVPLEYFNQQSKSREVKDEKNNVSYKFFQTNNPDYFWQRP